MAWANLIALTGPQTGIFNVGTGVAQDINTLHRLLAQYIGYTQTPAYVPRPVGEVLATYLDVRKSAAELNWRAEVDLAEGLRRTVAWFQSRS